MGLLCLLGIHDLELIATCQVVATFRGSSTGFKSEDRQSVTKHFQCRRCRRQQAQLVDLNGNTYAIDPGFIPQSDEGE